VTHLSCCDERLVHFERVHERRRKVKIATRIKSKSTIKSRTYFAALHLITHRECKAPELRSSLAYVHDPSQTGGCRAGARRTAGMRRPSVRRRGGVGRPSPNGIAPRQAAYSPCTFVDFFRVIPCHSVVNVFVASIERSTWGFKSSSSFADTNDVGSSALARQRGTKPDTRKSTERTQRRAVRLVSANGHDLIATKRTHLDELL
jgi:hypothetical protein